MKKILDLNLKALEAIKCNDYSNALKFLKKSLKININQPNVLLNIAIVLQERHEIDPAIYYLKILIKISDNFPEAHFQLATIYKNQHKFIEAIDCYQGVLLLKPDQPEVLFNLANTYRQIGKIDPAIYHYKKLLHLQPNNYEAMNNLSLALCENSSFDEAATYCELAIHVHPNVPESYNNMGNVLKYKNDFAGAIDFYTQAIDLNPDNAEFFYNLGNAYQETLQFEKSFSCFDQALKIKQDYYPAIWNKALLNLLLGNFEEGWLQYEYRWLDQQKHKRRNIDAQLWLGNESLSGKSILVISEQGFGDTIQFYRYVQMLDSLASNVTLEVPPELFELLLEQTPRLALISKGQVLPQTDFYIPIMSLPLAFKTTTSTIPSSTPYIGTHNPTNKVFVKNKSCKVGIVWKGSKTHKEDRLRSMSLVLFQSLLILPIEFHVIQKELTDEEKALLITHPNVSLHHENLSSFLDTASIINGLDLVISVDTAVAHLAGSMGKDTWLMVPFIPEFRWLLDRNDSPWYPTMTIFRQGKDRDWLEVIDAIKHALLKKLT